jgi:dipeptidyl aminopeptidase/acylaminoacyl peptidase
MASGHDFFSSPRVSPDGRRLAWLVWDHPRMPWDGTELWVAVIEDDGSLAAPTLVAGGPEESVCQPEWSPDGRLYFVSDRSGWWNLYRHGDGTEAICPLEAEFAGPQWTFGNAMYGFISANEIACTYIERGVSRLARLVIGSAKLEPIASPYEEIRELRTGDGFIALLGGSPTIPAEIARIDLASGELEVLARSIDTLPDAGYLSIPESIRYPSENGRTAYAFFYPPHNRDAQAPAGEKPPVIVIGHGGPTGMATSTLKLATQFWTSRGFGVLDVNYGGSTGFGRAYRDALKGQWGVVDVEDCVAGARWLVGQGRADGERLIVRGSSAGGYTTLCALAFHDVFRLGASYYGVADLQGLDDDSHKFESHYNEYLVAPQPRAQQVYLERSPSHHVDRLACPMIFFQGLDDKVVPPQQSETMVKALRQRGVPVAYVELEGEGHGFRKAESIVRTLEAELYFYLRLFGLHDAAAPAPVAIDNLDAAA